MPVGRRSRVWTSQSEQSGPDRFPSATFEEHVAGNDHRGASVNFEKTSNVLDEVQMFVAGAGPEIITLDILRLTRLLALFVHDGDAGFLAERRISQHEFVVFTPAVAH